MPAEHRQVFSWHTSDRKIRPKGFGFVLRAFITHFSLRIRTVYFVFKFMSRFMNDMDFNSKKRVSLNEKGPEFEFGAFRFVWCDKNVVILILPDTEINHNSGILVNDLFSQTTYFLSSVINSMNLFLFYQIIFTHHFFQKKATS